MSEIIIGILAGMGPRSTAPFIDMIVDECQLQYGAKYDEEFPEMLISSLPTPFYLDRPIHHELMKETIASGLRKLESFGAGFIAMPCNSAHIYFEELAASINIKLLNIVDETVKTLPGTSQKVTLFSTGTTFESGIYQKGITEAGHEFVFAEEWQGRLNQLIQRIKTDRGDPRNSLDWKELLEEVRQEAVDNIIVACTDLNALIHGEKVQDSEINWIDSAKSLARSTVREYLKGSS